MSAYVWWLIVGAVMLSIEVFAMPTFVLFFAGLAAICVGVMVGTGMLDELNYLIQWAWFFGLTAVLAALLWKPVKQFRTTHAGAGHYNNITGDIATVIKGSLKKGAKGTVEWSGTTMNAKLLNDAPVDELPEGAIVEIVEVQGNMLIVTPKR